MSLCSNSLRAWSRSRVPKSKTLLPFLYQTATIQQCTTATRHDARRSFRSRSNGNDDVPFEDGTLPPAVEDEPVRPTTITDTERKAFRKLYQTATRQEQEKGKSGKQHAIVQDEIADEYYEEDEDSPVSLDQVFDDVLKGKPALKARQSPHQSRLQRNKPPPKTAQSTSQKDPGETQATSPTKAAIKELKLRRTAELQRFTTLLSTAKTDLDLWALLETHVLTPVRQLDLDGTSKTKADLSATTRLNAKHSKLKFKKSITEPFEENLVKQRILFQNFPHYLIHAVTTLRDAFPSSPLPLSILPAIKALGRSSYALGATTTLYKHLLRTAWLHHSSYATIDALLTDMENSAIEFDADILALLDSIIKEHNMALSGVFGREMLMVYGMEMFGEGVGKIRHWREVLEKRLAPVKSTASPLAGMDGNMMEKYKGPRLVGAETPVGGLNGPVRRREGEDEGDWRAEKWGRDGGGKEGRGGGARGGRDDGIKRKWDRSLAQKETVTWRKLDLGRNEIAPTA
ncbi:hypothetical protein NX059_004660 [Plenodomus lindquistii]|nr:hypothetical protein NX059_004660 [Plenodomus lindquistii]